MGLVGLTLGFLCALTALFTAATRGKRRDHDDTLLAFALTWAWSAAIVVQMITAHMGADEGRLARFEAGAVIDLVTGLFIASRLRVRAAGWKWAMAALMGAALLADVAFLLSDRTRETGNMCKFALNVIFVAALACVCSSGANHAFRRHRVRLPYRLRSRIAARGEIT